MKRPKKHSHVPSRDEQPKRKNRRKGTKKPISSFDRWREKLFSIPVSRPARPPYLARVTVLKKGRSGMGCRVELVEGYAYGRDRMYEIRYYARERPGRPPRRFPWVVRQVDSYPKAVGIYESFEEDHTM